MKNTINAFRANTTVATVVAKGTTEFQAVHNELLTNEVLDDRFITILSQFTGTELESKVISQLSYKLPMYTAVIEQFGSYYVEKAKLSLAKTLINMMVNDGIFTRKVETKREFIEGKPQFRHVNSITFTAVKDDEMKDITRGISTEPGVILSNHVKTKTGGKPMKLTSEQKTYLRHMSSKALRLVRVPEATLRAYYKQTEWYIQAVANKLEDPILLNVRIEKYISTIRGLQQEKALYLSNWFDARLRTYYELSMAGINPHGDTFETAMWEMATPQIINQGGKEELKWDAMVIAYGRMTKEQALAEFTDTDAMAEVMLDISKYDFGELFYNQRLLDAIQDAEEGEPSHFMVGIDATTGGLQRAGASFKSVKSASASNIGGAKTVNDAHQVQADAFGLDRYTIKTTVNTPLLHGASANTIVKLLADKGVETTRATVESQMAEAYGPEILNVGKIAAWGNLAYTNDNSTLLFSAPDGMKCQSTCYSESVKCDVYGIDTEAKQGYNSVTVHRDMPLLLSAKGEVVHDNTKNMGVYANITHAIDGCANRDITRAIDGALLTKHDKFFACPNDMYIVRATYLETIMREYEGDFYAQAMEEISANRKGAVIPVPELVYGDLNIADIAISHSFLMA